MKKSVRLRVTVVVRGEDALAADFAAAGRAVHAGLAIAVQRIAEVDADDDDDAGVRGDD